MPSTQRNDTSVAVFLDHVAKCMLKKPKMTFGQLLYAALQDTPGHDQPLDVAINLRRLTDTQIAEALSRFALKG
jgi:hypothetical protein